MVNKLKRNSKKRLVKNKSKKSSFGFHLSKHAEGQGMKIFLVAGVSILLIAILAVLLFYQDDSVAGQAVSTNLEQDFIEVHGRYSSDYESDWADLPTGKEIAEKDFSNVKFEQRTYLEYGAKEEGFQFLDTYEDVTISDLYYEIDWESSEPEYYGNYFIRIRNAGDVTLENINIKQNTANRGRYSILVEGCDTFSLKDSYFEGAVINYHVHVEDCQKIFIDGVEVKGKSFQNKDGSVSYESGGGISVMMGDKGEHPTVEPEWVVIQNNYFHDMDLIDQGNYDALAIRSPGDGILFNNVFENIKGGMDTGLDLGHGRQDHESYQNKLFRMERNQFIDVPKNKMAATDGESNTIFAVNNIYQNSGWTSYFCGYPIFYAFETYYFDVNNEANQYYNVWGCSPERFSELPGVLPHGDINQHNSLFVVEDGSGLVSLFTVGGYLDPQLDGLDVFNLNNNVYLSGTDIVKWLHSNKKEDFNNLVLDDWKGLGNDVASTYDPTNALCFEENENGEFIPSDDCVAKESGDFSYLVQDSSAGWQVVRDFYGNKRDISSPSVGAVENGILILLGISEFKQEINENYGEVYDGPADLNEDGQLTFADMLLYVEEYVESQEGEN